MKRQITYIIIAILALASCKKEEDTSENTSVRLNNFVIYAYNYFSDEDKITICFFHEGFPDQIPEVIIDGEKLNFFPENYLEARISLNYKDSYEFSISTGGKTVSGTIEMPEFVEEIKFNETELGDMPNPSTTYMDIPDNFTITWVANNSDNIKCEFYLNEKDSVNEIDKSSNQWDIGKKFTYSLINQGFFISSISGFIYSYSGVDFTVSNPATNFNTEIGNGYVYAARISRVSIRDNEAKSSKILDKQEGLREYEKIKEIIRNLDN